jgi:hypothetical protein
MSWTSDFDSQWQTFLNTVETSVRRELKSTGKLNAVLVNKIIHTEVAKWSSGTHFNGAWLRNLTQEFPILGREFQVTLEDLGIHESISSVTKPPLLAIASVGILVIVTFFVTDWYNLSLLKQTIATVAVALLAFPLITAQRNNQKEKVAGNFVEQVQIELEPTGRKLRSITVQADKSR